MSLNSVFSQKSYKIFVRIAAALAIVILISSIITNIFIYKPDSQEEDALKHLIILVVENSIAIIPCIFILINPKFDFLIAFDAFLFSVEIAFHTPENVMSIYMFALGFVVLYATHRLDKNRIPKLIILGVLLIIEYLFAIRFGAVVFLSSLHLLIGHVFVLSLILYFVVFALKRKSNENSETSNFTLNTKSINSTVLNLAEYPELKQSDVDLLKYIQEGKSYSEIAAKIKSSEGYMKNQFAKIYKTLSVTNKKEFLVKYGESKIVFEAQEPALASD
ncbi:MAG: hypothetical protein K6A43_09290 [Treponema sp.]|nr:hypothetical protein [Treponema sp.]